MASSFNKGIIKRYNTFSYSSSDTHELTMEQSGSIIFIDPSSNDITFKLPAVADNAGDGAPDKWASGFVQGGSAGESIDSYSTGGNRSYTSHGLAKQRAKDAAGNQDCPGDPRPNCGCATGLRLVNGLCAHQD